MARRIFVTLLVLVAACAVMAQSTPRCPENEYWNTCGNACVEPKCDNGGILVNCLLKCEPRCECLKGYCRDNAKKCVYKEDY